MKTLSEYKALLEDYLNALPISGAPEKLQNAMRYSLLSGGKRLRGCLLLAADDLCGGSLEAALPFAGALEMIHAYSLIHDDLPAMDNDTLRRGKPTNHVVFGEAMAILAGDGLLTFAFETMAASSHPSQVLDVTNEGNAPEMSLVQRIHAGKTAAMLTSPMTAGLILGGAKQDMIEAGRAYGHHLGMAFQIVDDLLDLEGDPVLMGKTLGKDIQEGKMTWVACVGADQARRDAEAHIESANRAFSPYDREGFFTSLALSTLRRVQ